LAVSFLVLAALYLAGVNAALNLPAARDLLNRMQPERFRVTWQRAWSLYPLRLELMGVAAETVRRPPINGSWVQGARRRR